MVIVVQLLAILQLNLCFQEILRLRDRVNEMLADHTGKKLDAIAKDTDRDFFMSAEDARDYGLVDEVEA